MLRREPRILTVLALMFLMVTGSAMAKTTTLEFWTISLSPWFDDYINGTIAEYEARNPGIKIVWKDIPIDAIQQKLLAAIAGGVSPDVVNLNTEFAFELAERNALVDLEKAATAEMKDIFFEGI